jgi:hypothetical protein
MAMVNSEDSLSIRIMRSGDAKVGSEGFEEISSVAVGRS